MAQAGADVAFQTSDRRRHTGGQRPQTANRKPQTADRRPQTADRRPQTQGPLRRGRLLELESDLAENAVLEARWSMLGRVEGATCCELPHPTTSTVSASGQDIACRAQRKTPSARKEGGGSLLTVLECQRNLESTAEAPTTFERRQAMPAGHRTNPGGAVGGRLLVLPPQQPPAVGAEIIAVDYYGRAEAERDRSHC
ncbi:hypothetical protein K490DRAFT_57941 [Saccharata proteae CBS 121410]|uniref:Uncharacterized protein n=1 Tax=Saccharata proteae CBS 121410 TaxID=1314787 RepID=A0A9P4HUS3_9PEZI|nr:hypothetical protein K490DRAFT_57941 [Saccharata proteae CBS 121410]